MVCKDTKLHIAEDNDGTAMTRTLEICCVLLVNLVYLGSRVTTASSVTSFFVHTSGSTRKGETLTLSCLLDGPPQTEIFSPKSYIWLKNGEPIPGQTLIDLVLRDLTGRDEGDYMCGSPDVDIPQGKYQLDLFPSLPRPQIVQAVVAVGGQKSSLSCVVQDDDSMNGKVQYTWYKDSKQIKGQSGPVLWFDNVTEEDKGNYSCTAWKETLSEPSLESPVFSLTPLVVPEVSIKPATPDSIVKGILEGNLTLTCEARAYPDVPDNGYSWYYHPSYQLPQQPLGQNSSILKLSFLTKGDSGIYICEARNDQNLPGLTLSGQASVTVDVVYLQNISMSPDQTVHEKNPVRLECSVDSRPKAYITWNVNGMNVHRTIGNNDYFNISQASCSDTGTYICRAVNPDMPENEISASAQVRVLCSTERPIERRKFDVIQPNAAPFDFTLPSKMSMVVVHPSGQDMVIIHPNCSFLISSAFLPRCLHPYCDLERHRFYFALINVTESDEGNYFCLEGEKLRKQMPNCGKILVLKMHLPDDTQQGSQIWLSCGAVAVIVIIGVVAFLVKRANKCPDIISILRRALVCQTKPEDRFEDEDLNHSFESMYRRGTVYKFPQLFRPEQKENTDDKEVESGSATQLLYQNSHDMVENLEYAVKDLVRFVLQKSTSPEDLPSFLLHNTSLSKNEKIILILSRKLGIGLMCVKIMKDGMHKHVIEGALKCIREVRKALGEELTGLVKPEAIEALLSLPNVSQDDIAYLKAKDVKILSGLEKRDFEMWAEQLCERPESEVWDISTSDESTVDIAFKEVSSKLLTLAGGSQPGEPLALPPTMLSQLLSPAQMEVRDSPAKLLHMWGPPGEGKTAVLIYRALRWLAEGKAVIAVAARDMVEAVIMQHQSKYPKLRKCHTPEDIETALKELKTSYPGVEICIITGILHRPGVLQSLLDAAKSNQVSAVLSLFTDNLQSIDRELGAECNSLGWKIVHFPQQIRRPEDTGSLLTLLKALPSDQKPASGSYVQTQDNESWKVVDHCLHQNCSSNTSCDDCKEELTPPLPSTCPDPQWSDWIVFHTGNPHLPTDPQLLCNRLQGLGVPAVDPNKHGEEANASYPAAGMDKEQSNVPLLWVFDELELKRSGVLMVHCDDRDNQQDCQSKRDRHQRFVDHRKQWIQAALSSTEQIILLLLTPSPARSLLGLPDPGAQMQPST